MTGPETKYAIAIGYLIGALVAVWLGWWAVLGAAVIFCVRLWRVAKAQT